MSLSLSCQSKQHRHADRGRDLYETPSIAIEALQRAEQLPHVIWEPAAGRGAIVRVLRNAGHSVIASDINSYDHPLNFVCDFLTMTQAPAGAQAIVTNPPYRLAGQFVAQALRLCPLVAMLCRLAFLESVRRAAILDAGMLARVHVFRRRLPMMHRDGWSGPRAASAIPFAWFVWDRKHAGPTTIDRIG
jgi:hypothetical protein